jgi:hypothetical protein
MKEAIIEIFESTKETVNNSLSTIYSKQDVFNIIESLKQKTLLVEHEKPEVNLDEIADAIVDVLDSTYHYELIDTSSAEFTIGYDNKVELQNVDLNSDQIATIIINKLSDIL